MTDDEATENVAVFLVDGSRIDVGTPAGTFHQLLIRVRNDGMLWTNDTCIPFHAIKLMRLAPREMMAISAAPWSPSGRIN